MYRDAVIERSRTCAGATDVGPVRDQNEDAYWISEDASLLVVADGLGGLPGGDVASAIAVETIDGCLRDAAAGRIEASLRDAVANAQKRILAAAAGSMPLRGMATTIVVAYIEKALVTVLQVGDSRAYLWRDGSFIQRTYDHNAVGDLVRNGRITADEARFYPGRNLVREVLGLADGYEPEVQTWPVRPGDIVLICTDGVTEALEESTLARILESAPSASAAAATLVSLAGVEGGSDNATAIVRYVF
jgi:PPM family protein phosphatase